MRPTPADIVAGAGGTRPLTLAELTGALRHGITTFHALFNLWRLLQFGAASNKKGAALFGVSYSTFAAWTAGDHFPPLRYRDAITRVTGIACVHLEGARRDEELRVARIARRAAKTERAAAP